MPNSVRHSACHLLVVADGEKQESFDGVETSIEFERLKDNCSRAYSFGRRWFFLFFFD